MSDYMIPSDLKDKPQEHILKLNDVRLSFPVLFEAKSFEEGGKKEFSGSFLIPKTNTALLGEIKAAMLKVATGKWGAKAEGILTTLFRDDRLCLHDGDRKDYDGYEGHFFLRASNQVRPLLIDRSRNPVTEADGKIYAGCYVNVTVSLWAQDNKFGKRINANLRGVQFFRDGEAFSGGVSAQPDEFEALEPVGATNQAITDKAADSLFV